MCSSDLAHGAQHGVPGRLVQRFESIAYNDDSCACASGCGTSGTESYASTLGADNPGIPLTQDLVAGQQYVLIVGTYAASASVSGTITVSGPTQPPACAADLNGDHVVNGADLGLLLGNWGHVGVGDLDHDGTVTGADLEIGRAHV